MSQLADVEAALRHAEAIGLTPGLPSQAGERLGCLMVCLDRVREEWQERPLDPYVSPLIEAIRAELGVPLVIAADEVRRLKSQRDHLLTRLDVVYAERNAVAALLATVVGRNGWGDLYGAGLGRDESQPPEWQTTILIDTPNGQISFHVHERERDVFGKLAPYAGRFGPGWDGHTDEQKWERVRRSIGV